MNNLGQRIIGIAKALGAAIGIHVRRLASPPQPVWIGDRVFIARPEPERLPRLPNALWSLFLARLNRAVRRLEFLHRAWSEGSLPPSRPPRTRPRTPAAVPADPGPREPRPRLPRAFGWINHRVPDSHQLAGLLHYLVQEPATRDFLLAVPRAGRLLRPLCVALGVEQPSWLRLPPRPRKPRPPRPRKLRRLTLTDPSLKLSPWVVAAVRGFQRQERKKRRG